MTSTEISSHQMASTKNTKPDTPSDARLNSAGKPWPGSEKSDTESSIKPRGIVARPGKAAHFDRVILQDPQRTKNWLMSPNTERYSAQHYQQNGEADDMDFEDEMRKLQIDLNKFCCECHAPDPDWVSVNNGVFLCIQCAGRLRGGGGRAVSQSNPSRKTKDVSRDDSWELLGAEDHAPGAPKSAQQLLNKDFHR